MIIFGFFGVYIFLLKINNFLFFKYNFGEEKNLIVFFK